MLSRALLPAVAASVFAFVTHGYAAADDAVTLAWKFKKGEKLHYVVEQNTSSEGKFGGQEFKSDFKQTLDMAWSVDEVAADGTAHMTQTVTRARLKISQPGGLPGIDYDSASKEAPQGAAAPVATVFKVLVGKNIKLKMSPRGKISEVALPEGMAEELKKTQGAVPGATLTEESFKEMTGASTLEFADHPVKKGDTWQRKTSVANPQAGGKQTTEITYTYQGTEKKDGKQIDKIDMTMKTSLAPGGAGAPQVEIKDQQSEGEVDFDRHSGHVIKTQATVKMTMALNVMGQKIDQTVTSDTAMRLADGKEAEKSSDDEK